MYTNVHTLTLGAELRSLCEEHPDLVQPNLVPALLKAIVKVNHSARFEYGDEYYMHKRKD